MQGQSSVRSILRDLCLCFLVLQTSLILIEVSMIIKSVFMIHSRIVIDNNVR